MKRFLWLLVAILAAGALRAADPDIIVTNSGEALKVYNMERTESACFYQLRNSDDAPIHKIKNSDIMIIKLADGTKIDPSSEVSETKPAAKTPKTVKSAKKEESMFDFGDDDTPSQSTPAKSISSKSTSSNRNASKSTSTKNTASKSKSSQSKSTESESMFSFSGDEDEAPAEKPAKRGYTSRNNDSNPNDHEVTTHMALGPIVVGKKGVRTVPVGDGKGQRVNMRIVDHEDYVLAVTKPEKDRDYEDSRYVIPEYVDIDGDIYTVKYVDDEAFKNLGFWTNDQNTREIYLPTTLVRIGDLAFAGRDSLRFIGIPDGVISVGKGAFTMCGRTSGGFEGIYIPDSVTRLGDEAFRTTGTKTSYRGYYQGYVYHMPSFINEDNCKDYGIDEEAVEAYYRRNR